MIYVTFVIESQHGGFMTTLMEIKEIMILVIVKVCVLNANLKK